MSPLLMLAVWTAHAQEPTPEEMIIVAEYSVQEARRDLDSTLREMGYRRPVRIGDRMVYTPERIWKPRVALTDEGILMVRGRMFTPVAPLVPTTVLFDSTFTDPDRQPLSLSDDMRLVRSEGWGATSTAQRSGERRRAEGQIVDNIYPEYAAWRQALWELNRLHREEEIRERLWAIWQDSRSADARRAEILQMWVNTADSSDGERVRAQIEVFMQDVVQASPEPYTHAEIATINEQRGFERALRLEGPLTD